MDSLLNSNQINDFTVIFGSHFQTFASGSNNFISVIKAPIQVINATNPNALAGYPTDTFNITDITYQPITGVFPAIIIYPHNLQANQFGQLKFDIDENQVVIKVMQDAKDYILIDGLERIIIDDQTYNAQRTFKVQSFLGLKYYYFKLTITK